MCQYECQVELTNLMFDEIVSTYIPEASLSYLFYNVFNHLLANFDLAVNDATNVCLRRFFIIVLVSLVA